MCSDLLMPTVDSYVDIGHCQLLISKEWLSIGSVKKQLVMLTHRHFLYWNTVRNRIKPTTELC